jgi:Bacterial Ig-like domain (group 3)/FG-GAP-like repeat/FG-GAP repeat
MPDLPSRRFFCFVVALIVSLLLSAQAATFKNPELIETSYDPIGTATADFNHDGNLDLAYVDGTSSYTLHVLLGNGNGTFSHSQDIELPTGICGYLTCVINLADVTGDGNTDIVLGGSGSTYGQIAVLAGNGNGTFQPPIVSIVTNSGENGGYPSLNTQMGIGDVNGDGAADLVIADESSATLYVLLGNNSGKFTIGTTITFYFSGPTLTYLFDLNGDGYLDIVVNNLVGAQTLVLLGNGNGTFQPVVTYNTTYALLLADMNGDGHPDLVGAVSPGEIEISPGNPDGTFGTPVVVATVPATARLIATGDFNGDGIQDLVFLTPAGVSIALGKGNFTYGNMTSSVAGSLAAVFYQTGDITQGDFNGNGNNGLAMGVDGGLLILAGNGDGTFASADSYDLGHTVGTVAVADFNGNKTPDIAVTVSATYPRLLLGNGAGQFTLGTDQNQSYGSQPPSGSLATGDFNGDGNPDLYELETTEAYQHGQPFILFGEGNGTFATPSAISTGPALVADLTNNGRSDMVSQSGNSILALLGQTNETFTQVTTSLIYPTGGVAAVGNLNHDDIPDLLMFEPPSFRVWLGNGDGTFTESNLVSDPSQQISVQSAAIADLNGDGNPDIVVVPYPNQLGLPLPLLIYYGNSDGTFQDAVSLPISHAYTQLVIADVNQDNKPDLVLSDSAGIAVIENLGGGNFAPEEHFVAGQEISGLSVVDVNGDGFPDIVAANAGGTTVAVLLNQPNGNPIDGAPSNGSFSISPEPAKYGQAITLSITMSVPSGPVPTGSVSFSVDGSFIVSVSLSNGTASHKFGAILNTGTHTFVATYNGDKTYAPESFSVLHVVLAPVYATQTVLVATPDVVLTSQTVSLTATVTSSVTVPAGFVTFLDGTNTLGTRAIYESPTVLLDTNLLAQGIHTLTAVYQGYQEPFDTQAIFQPSASAPVTMTVNATSTTTGISASTTSPTAGTVVTFTANVTANSGAPFGGATFYDGTIPLGTSSLQADGSSIYSTASLAVGAHNITAVFNANATFASSTSSVIVVTVASAEAGLSPTVVTMGATGSGDQALLAAQVSALHGLPAGEVIFLDDGNILGSTTTNGSGFASLTVPALGGGVHNLYASFAGASQFAPTVSPELLEQFPAGATGFSLSFATSSVDVTSAGSQTILVTIVPTAGFQQPVELSCASGVPSGYECSFSPASLYAGNSYLRIQASAKAAVERTGAGALYGALLGVFSFLLIGAVSLRRPHCLVLLMACLWLTVMPGCGNPPSSSASPQMMVLSIQATARNGGATIVHSAQILLNVRSPE